MKNDLNLKGMFHVKHFRKGKLINERKIYNTMMRDSVYLLIGALQGATPNLEIKYCAVGTGTTAVSSLDTLLDTEYFRTYKAGLNRDGYLLLADFTFTKAEANTTLNELGIFCGTTATVTVDTGTLWSRQLLNPPIVKTSDDELVVQYSVNFIRG